MGLPKKVFIKGYLRKTAPGAYYYYGSLREVAPRLQKLRDTRCTIDEALLRVRKRSSASSPLGVRKRPVEAVEDPVSRPPAAKRRKANGRAAYEPVFQEEEEEGNEEEEEEVEREVYIIYTVDVMLHMYAAMIPQGEDGVPLTGASVVNAIFQRWVVDLLPHVDELVFAMDGPKHTRPPIKMRRSSRGIVCFKFTEPVSDMAFPDRDQWTTQKSDPDFHYEVVKYLTGALIKRVHQEVMRPRLNERMWPRRPCVGTLKRLVIDISVPSKDYGCPEDYGEMFNMGHSLKGRNYDFSQRYCSTVVEYPRAGNTTKPNISFHPRVYNRETHTGCDTCEADAALFSYIADARTRIWGKRVIGLISTNDTDAYVYSLAMAERFATHHEGLELVIVGKNFRTKKAEDRGVWTKKYELVHMTAVREAIAKAMYQHAVDSWGPRASNRWIKERLRGCVLCVCLLFLSSGSDFNPGLGSYLGLPPDVTPPKGTRVPLAILINHLPRFLTRNGGSRQKMIDLLPHGEFRVNIEQCTAFIADIEAQRRRLRKPGRTRGQMMKIKATFCNARFVLRMVAFPGDDKWVQSCLERSPEGLSLHGWVRDPTTLRVYQDTNVAPTKARG